ncbi:MAG TPA: DsbE family thiol:disulfide interchange protein, partial [Kiloniellales bacterium]|nr:DsbE family thiol:disulfide interchange protein [Kiloniellales bacterium]
MSALAERAARPTARRILYLLPVVVFALVAGTFLWGLDPARDPSNVPSVMIDEPAPAFDLPPIAGMEGPGLSDADLRTGRVTLVNFFASWCIPCRIEHPQLTALSEEHGVTIYGINYKDEAGDATRWLADLGDPFARIGADTSGRVAIDWGVYGVPETF